MPHTSNSDLETPENSGSGGSKHDAHPSPHLLAIAQLLELMGLKHGTPEYIEQFQLELDRDTSVKGSAKSESGSTRSESGSTMSESESVSVTMKYV